MPYPNEHSARLQSPDKFDRFRSSKSAKVHGVRLPNGTRAIWGHLKGRGPDDWAVQAIRFNVDKWTAAEAKAWLKENDIKYIKFEAATRKKGDAVMQGCQLDRHQVNATNGKWEGGNYVIPASITAEGVHLGFFKPAAEIEKIVSWCNGLPIITQMYLHMPESMDEIHMDDVVGYTRNAEWDAAKKKVRCELVITDPTIAAQVAAGEFKELSLGFDREMYAEPGEYGGVQYGYVERNILPLHVFIARPGTVTVACPPPICGIGQAANAEMTPPPLRGDGTEASGMPDEEPNTGGTEGAPQAPPVAPPTAPPVAPPPSDGGGNTEDLDALRARAEAAEKAAAENATAIEAMRTERQTEKDAEMVDLRKEAVDIYGLPEALVENADAAAIRKAMASVSPGFPGGTIAEVPAATGTQGQVPAEVGRQVNATQMPAGGVVDLSIGVPVLKARPSYGNPRGEYEYKVPWRPAPAEPPANPPAGGNA